MMPTERGDTAAAGVLHVVDSLERGGLERVVVDLAIAQRAAGRPVAVFSINATGGFRAELEGAGVPVLIGNKSGTLDLRVIRALRQAADAKCTAIVHAHNFTPNYYSAAALFGVWRSPVQVTTCHDMGTRLTDRKLRWMYRASLLRTRRAAMVSGQVRETYVASGMIPAARAITIANGIPIERFRTSPDRRRHARALLGLPDDVPTIGCVGRLVPVKNHRLLLSCVAALVARHRALRVVLVGGGELEVPLRAQVEDAGLGAHVDFAGERADVADLLHAFDIFALPSFSEGLSIALLEAGASGLAIVATDVGGNAEIVRDGVTGVLVPSDDGAALEQALDGLLGDAAQRERLGHAASEWAAAHASIDAMRRHYDRFYKDALAASDRPPVSPRVT